MMPGKNELPMIPGKNELLSSSFFPGIIVDLIMKILVLVLLQKRVLSVRLREYNNRRGQIAIFH